MAATKTIKEIYGIYKPKIYAYLGEIRRKLQILGFNVDLPCETSDEEYQWSLFADKNDSQFMVEFTIVEEAVREGSGDGVSFSLRVDGPEETIACWTPYNYTPQVYVSPKDAEQRWLELVGGVSPDRIVNLINEGD